MLQTPPQTSLFLCSVHMQWGLPRGSKWPNWFPALPQQYLDLEEASVVSWIIHRWWYFWTLISYCLLLWLLTVLLVLLLPTTDFSCTYKKSDSKIPINLLLGKSIYIGTAIIHLKISNISYVRHRDRFLDFIHRLELGLCKALFLKRSLRSSLTSQWWKKRCKSL